jgi:hypothetical protein
MSGDIDVAIQQLDIAKTILIQKSLDYNSGPIKLFDYYLYGEKSILHEIWKKVLRLRSLESCDKPNFESKEDTLIDLINYAAIYLSYLKRHSNDQ